jgi:membrane-associated protease RseP (regulator of RpoE activity)
VTILIYGFGAALTYFLATAVYVLAQAFVGIAAGIKAEAISVGFGPVLFRRTVRGCELRLSAIPWGGYTKFRGMEPAGADEPPGSYLRASPWMRMAVCLIGPITNLAAGLVFPAIPVEKGADQMVAASRGATEVQSCAVEGLAFRPQPSTWESQIRLVRETAGEFARRTVLFESLDGWGGPVGFVVTSGAIARVSVMGWLTAQGVLLIASGLFNLLPVPALNGFQFLVTAFEMIFRGKPSDRAVVFLTYVGLFVLLVLMGRVLYADIVWVIHALRS